MATTEELLQAQAQAATPAAATPTVANTATPTTPATTTAPANTATTPAATALNQRFAQYTGGNYDNVNAMYNAQREANLANLESTYQRQLSAAQAARDKLPETYQRQANDLAVQYERNRRNLNEQAAAHGLNTGAGSQQRLSLNSTWNRDYGNLRTAEASAIAEADRGIADLGNEYQTNIRAAVADNDYRRAAALLDEYNTQYTRNLNDAKTKAAYGDFSGYASIYGQESANAMRNTWISQNPDIAYRTGAIDANRYHTITGNWPAGYSAPSSGGGGGGYYGGGGGGYTHGSTPKTAAQQIYEKAMSMHAAGYTDSAIFKMASSAGQANSGVSAKDVQAAYQAYKKTTR